MKNLTLFLFLISYAVFSQNAWINEFHYDNSGTPDIGEFVEVAIENSSNYDLDDFRISFYSSVSGIRYGVYHQLSSFDKGETDEGITLYSKYISGIQNGPNDGIALDYLSKVLHFISYEGTVTASEGVAEGITSEDVGVSESNSTSAGSSIGLNGTGTQVSNFNWVVLSNDSPGSTNDNQILPVELATFKAIFDQKIIQLYWETVTEVNNFGFEVERKDIFPDENRNDWKIIGFVPGHGNSNSKKSYHFNDINIELSGYYGYRLKQIDVDGKFKFSKMIEIELAAPDEFQLFQNYPNPFNPITSIGFTVPHNSHIELNVLNILGEKIKELVKGELMAGTYKVEFNGKNFSNGIYYYELKCDNFRKTMKMMLIK